MLNIVYDEMCVVFCYGYYYKNNSIYCINKYNRLYSAFNMRHDFRNGLDTI